MAELEFVISDGPRKGQAFPFPGAHFYVGSGEDCHLRFSPAEVEAKHAEVILDGTGVPWMRDLTGSGKVWINGEPAEKGPLQLGGFVRVGQLEFVLRQRGRSGPSGTMATPAPAKTGSATGSNQGIGATSIRPSQARQQAVGATGVIPAQANQRPSQAHQAGVDSTAIRPSGGGQQAGIDATAKRPTPFAQSASGEPARVSDETVRSAALQPGTVIDGRYHIIGKLAAGGMGEVYRAEHVELGKAMALKVMLPELSQDPEFVARFKREAIAASRIGQQNIVDISDFGRTQDGRFYFVMEFLDGMTLASLLHRQGALPIERAINISLQACRALAAAHAQGIVHRDLKPENIMLLQRPGQPDFVKVLDFGVAKVSHGSGQGGHTAVGMVVGTPQYMSPEQAKAIPVDARSDIYSMGLIIYELITGRPTFMAETPSMLMVKHVTEAPPPFTPGPLTAVPEGLERLVFQMLSKVPAERPQLMEHVVQSLETLWAQVRSGDVAANRVSGDYAPVGPPQQRPSGGYGSPISGQVQTAPITGQQYAQPASGANPAVPLPARSSAPLIVGGVLLVLALGGGVAWSFREPPPAPVVVAPPVVEKPVEKPVEAPKPVEVTIVFETTPDRAEVYDGDELLGTTPFTLNRKADELVTLLFQLKGHKPLTRKVRFTSSGKIAVELEKLDAAVPVRRQPGKTQPKGNDLMKDPYAQEEDLKPAPF